MMNKFCLTTVLGTLVFGTGSLRAEIIVSKADYASGVLVVRGETSRPKQRVTLDGHYRTRSDRENKFHFRVRYLPSDCGIVLRAGAETRPVNIANCETVAEDQKASLLKSDADVLAAGKAADTAKGAATATGPQVVPLTAKSLYQGWRASRLLGRDAVSQSGEKVGTVRNIVIGLDGRIAALIVEGTGSNGHPEFVYRIPWGKIQIPNHSNWVIADTLPFPRSEDGLLETEQARSKSTNEFTVTAVIGDYARLRAGQAYGYVSDVVFADGQMLAILVTRDFVAGGGTFAFGFPRTVGRWNPAAGYYGLPYVTAKQANAAAVRVQSAFPDAN